MIDMLIDFENGQLSEVDTIKLFSKLIKTGTIWHLQGSYQRNAYDMVEAGWMNLEGKILVNLNEIQ